MKHCAALTPSFKVRIPNLCQLEQKPLKFSCFCSFLFQNEQNFQERFSIVFVQSNVSYGHIKCTLNFYETAKNKNSFAVPQIPQRSLYRPNISSNALHINVFVCLNHSFYTLNTAFKTSIWQAAFRSGLSMALRVIFWFSFCRY